MTVYTINGCVEVITDECFLRNISTQDRIDLSPTSCRLLTYLLKHRSDVVSRDDIFNEVFDPFGVHSTNNNLNQYISSLRKNISLLGVESQVIITVPRVGFSIAAEADIVLRVNLPDEKGKEDGPVYQPGFSSMMISHLRDTVSNVYLFFCVFSILIAAITICLIYGLQEDPFDKITEITTLPFHDINVNGCRLQLIDSSSTPPVDVITKEFSEFQKTQSFNCSDDKTKFYYHRNTQNGIKYRAFILRCTEKEQGKPACFSNYISKEE